MIPPPPTPTRDDSRAAPPQIAAGGGGDRQASPVGPGRNRAAPPPSPGARYLRDQGFKGPAIAEWGHLPVDVLQASVERHRADGTKPGGMVLLWRILPPDQEAPPADAAPPPRVSSSAIHALPLSPDQKAAALSQLRATTDPREQAAVYERWRARAAARATG